MGWTKARELVKVARREGTEFDCAPWVHKAKELPKEEFEREVERYLTGKETEPWETIYFKLYKSQLPVVERALEIAALMLGSDKSRGYSLEMICVDFLAGAAIEKEESEPNHGGSASSGFSIAASEQPASAESSHMDSSITQRRRRIRKAPELYARLRREILERDGWRCQKCGCSKNLDVHHIRRRSAG